MAGTRPLSGHELIRKGLKFSQLRLIAALGDIRQIGAAAEAVGVSQPAASRLLSQLEATAGTPLHVRHARGIALTEAGRLLADHATAILQDLDRTHEQIAQIAGGVRGHVRIGSVTGPSLELVLPVLRELGTTFPDIEASVQVDTSDRLAEALLADGLDFYIGRIPDARDPRSFAIQMIGPEPIALMVREGHPLVRHPNPTLEDCLGYDWVMQPQGGLLRRTAEAYLLERGLPLPARVLGTGSILFTLAHVTGTDAIAPLARAMSDFFVDPATMGGRLAMLPVAPDMAVSDYGIVRRAVDRPTPATERVLEALRARI